MRDGMVRILPLSKGCFIAQVFDKDMVLVACSMPCRNRDSAARLGMWTRFQIKHQTGK